MENIHHKPIQKFFLDGVIDDDSQIARFKSEYIKLLYLEMKIAGYVPRLDIDPDFTISYNEKRECFGFMLSVYGTYVGKKKSEWIIGVDGTRVIFSQEIRSGGSSAHQESKLRKS
jgi:hypothetical protein